jgi:hypothetical protein
MLTPTGFSSWSNYFKFSFAREFIHQDTCAKFEYKRNLCEKIGGYLANPLFGPVDFLIREKRNPLLITSLAMFALALVSIAFYPTQFMAIVCMIVPFVSNIEPWMVKFACYVLSASIIAGSGIKTFGRLSNKILTDAWKLQTIRSLPIGAVLVSQIDSN